MLYQTYDHVIIIYNVTTIKLHNYEVYFSVAQQPLVGQGLLTVEASQSHSVRHTTFGRIPLDEWLARRRELYLTTHNTHKCQTSMSPAEFDLAILAIERPQTHALDRAATGIRLH
jgi:hypothetical protein